jgi:YNFM family putative membrane transporter
MTQSIFLEIAQTFGIGLTRARLSFSVVSLFYSLSFLFLGPLSDRYDLPRLAVTNLAFLGFTVLYASYAGSFLPFLFAMALMGMFAALIPVAMFPHIAVIAPGDRIGIYMGSIVASGTLGVIFGRTFMGVATSVMGWQTSFKMMSIIIFSFTALSFISLVEKSGVRLERSLSVLELYANSLRLLIKPEALFLLLAGFTLYFGFLGMVTFLTYRLVQAPFNFTAGGVGWISFAGITALVAPFASGIALKAGTLKVIFTSLLVCLLSLQVMGWFPSIPFITLGLLLLFLGVYICQPLLFLLMGKSVSKEALGSALSLYTFFCIGGGSLASILLGPVWRSYAWPGITVVCSVSLAASLLIMAVYSLSKNSRRADNGVYGNQGT